MAAMNRNWMLIVGLGALFSAIGVLGIVTMHRYGHPSWWELLGWGLIWVGCGAIMIYFGLASRRETAADAGIAPDADLRPVTPGPRPGHPWPTPWTPEQVAGELARRFEPTPYRVSAARGRIRVTANLADARFALGPGVQQVSTVFVSDVLVKSPGRAAVLDGERSLEWAAGLGGGLVPRFTGSASMSGGRSYSFNRRIDLGMTPTGIGRVVDYTFSSGDVHGPINDVLREAGWRQRLPAEARGALVMAAIGGGGAILALVVLAITGKLG